VTQLHRDRLTWLVYATLGVNGFFIYGFGISVPLLREDQGTSRAVSGLHSTALAVGAVVAGLAFAALVRRFGRGPVLAGGLLAIAVGTLAYLTSHTLALTLLGALLAGTAGSTVVNANAPILSDLHGAAGPAAISEANALATAAGALAPLCVGTAVALDLGWRLGYGVLQVGLVAVLVAGRGVRFPPPRAPVRKGENRHLPRTYWPSWTVLVLCIAVEFCVTIWSSDLLRQRLGVSDGLAAGSLALVVVGMTVGRLVGAQLTLRVALDGVLLGALAFAGLGFLLMWTGPNLAVAASGLLVLGLGMGMHYPLAISRAVARSDGQPDLAAARASIGAGVAIGTAPFLLGALADAFGTRTAFLLVPTLLLTAALVLVLSRGPVATALDEGAAAA
jgi:predicted MFS family arabinose efflux permease